MGTRRSFLTSLIFLGAAGGLAWWARDRLFWPTAAVAAEGDDSGWIPFLEGRSGLGLIPVGLAGRVVTALIDSGAQGSIIDRALAEDLALPTAPAPPMVTFGAGGHGETASGVDVAVEAGGLSFSRIRAARLDLGPISRPEAGGVGLILGQDVLQSVVADLDFPNRRARFRSPATHVDPQDLRVAPVSQRGRALEARLSIEGSVLDVLVDTGATAGLTLTRQAALAAGLLDGRPTERTRNVVLGGISEGESLEPGPLRFAGRVFEQIDVHVMADQTIPGFPRGLIGLGVFGDERVVLDLARGSMKLAGATPAS